RPLRLIWASTARPNPFPATAIALSATISAVTSLDCCALGAGCSFAAFGSFEDCCSFEGCCSFEACCPSEDCERQRTLLNVATISKTIDDSRRPRGFRHIT